VGLRLRVVPQRAYRMWGERVGELILLAIDETGWLPLVGLNNRGAWQAQIVADHGWIGTTSKISLNA
jgi:hypothetical protein